MSFYQLQLLPKFVVFIQIICTSFSVYVLWLFACHLCSNLSYLHQDLDSLQSHCQLLQCCCLFSHNIISCLVLVCCASVLLKVLNLQCPLKTSIRIAQFQFLAKSQHYSTYSFLDISCLSMYFWDNTSLMLILKSPYR